MLKISLYRVLFGLLLVFVLCCALTNVSTRVMPEDTLAIKAILGVSKPPRLDSFEDEIRVIRWAQAQVMRAAPGMEPIPDYADREPMALLRAQSGLCFDRSRTLDKVYKWLGFESRHVYILFANKDEPLNFWTFTRHALTRSASHAVTEVKTTKGWIMVGSNVPWISLNKDAQPVSADEIHDRRSEFESPPQYLEMPLWAIRGLYSRKGQLYKPYFTFPDVNWPDLLSWAIGWT